jgi:K(+)-stimulated pyrophosphate-energized sodium pump
VVKVFTSTHSRHVREVVTASKAGGASLNILSGLVAGYFSAFWIGVIIVALMSGAYILSQFDLTTIINPDHTKAVMMAAVFSFGLVAFGFLGMGPVTIAVDSYGPVTDNAQSVYELSMIEQLPNIEAEVKRDFGFNLDFKVAKFLLEENDGAGNTFKATAKPVLIGTAVVGATTMVFSIVMLLTAGLTENLDKLSLLHPPFLLGLVTGGATTATGGVRPIFDRTRHAAATPGVARYRARGRDLAPAGAGALVGGRCSSVSELAGACGARYSALDLAAVGGGGGSCGLERDQSPAAIRC